MTRTLRVFQFSIVMQKKKLKFFFMQMTLRCCCQARKKPYVKYGKPIVAIFNTINSFNPILIFIQCNPYIHSIQYICYMNSIQSNPYIDSIQSLDSFNSIHVYEFNSMLICSFNPILIFFLSNSHTVLIQYWHIFHSIQCQNSFNLPGASAAKASLSVKPSDPVAILVAGKIKMNVAIRSFGASCCPNFEANLYKIMET